jgi:hypothetical protein
LKLRIVMTTGSHPQMNLRATGGIRKIGRVPLVWVRDQPELMRFHSGSHVVIALHRRGIHCSKSRLPGRRLGTM